MTHRGELKPMDAYEQKIRDNAVAYNVVGFSPGSSTRVYMSFADLKYAIAYAKQLLTDEVRIRSAMLYAIDEYESHALIGTMNRDMVFKEVIPSTY